MNNKKTKIYILRKNMQQFYRIRWQSENREPDRADKLSLI